MTELVLLARRLGLRRRMSNEGDVVLDPFCGCGTTIAAAQKLNRQWIGIDITHLSIALQKYRLKDAFGLEPIGAKKATGPTKAPLLRKEGSPEQTYRIIGEPEDLDGARQLATEDRYQFQWWALSLIKARPLGGNDKDKTGKKGADKGIDGTITFIDEQGGKAKRVIVSVKSGHVNVAHIRDLGHVIDREQAAIGVYLTLEPATKPMITEALEKGFYHSPGWNRDYPRLQIVTIEDLLNGKSIEMPQTSITFKQAERMESADRSQNTLDFAE